MTSLTSSIVHIRVGDLRFQLPQALPPYEGASSAAAFGPACPQQSINVPIPQGLAEDVVSLLVNTLYAVLEPSSEDCG